MEPKEFAMPRMIAVIAVLLSTCSVAAGQTVAPSAMRATSPLGMPGSGNTSGPQGAGIPLGSTEIDVGGLSSTACTSSSASSIFDGGGLGGADSTLPQSTCTSPVNGASSGTGSPLSTPGASSSLALDGGTIPLGSTELNNAGVSPLIDNSTGSGLVTSCSGATMSTGSAPATGATGIGTTTLGTSSPC
jgi:hypothetical protein